VNASLRPTNAYPFEWDYQWVALWLLYPLEYDVASLADMILEIGGRSDFYCHLYRQMVLQASFDVTLMARVRFNIAVKSGRVDRTMSRAREAPDNGDSKMNHGIGFSGCAIARIDRFTNCRLNIVRIDTGKM
jgi:hypothetical protein